MGKISFIRSLMSFNQRVLSLGRVYKSRIYNMDELHERLRFNQIFISNTNEMFQKYNCKRIISDYIESLKEYHDNLSVIHSKIKGKRIGMRVDRRPSFYQRLYIQKIDLVNQLIVSIENNIHEFGDNLQDGTIYYLTLINPDNNSNLMISHVDNMRAVYNEILSYNVDGKTFVWKPDDLIKECINCMDPSFNTIAFIITRRNGKIVKMEYSGDDDVVKSIIHLFPQDTIVLSNDYIYTDDYERVLGRNIETSTIEFKQNTENINFDELFEKDMLIEYPSTSFNVYLEFLHKASIDLNVREILISLYRIGDSPEIFNILKNAVENGIYVHVNLELRASGEDINRFWLKEMRDVGIDVTTFMDGEIKVHSKITLVCFKDGKNLAQVGTGNYHVQTTSQYTDLSMITGNEEICYEAIKLFKLFKSNIEEYVPRFRNDKFLVTMFNARRCLKRLIGREASLGQDGYISIKCNSLDDSKFIKWINKAAVAGCKIDLIVRGVCTWVPDQIGSNVNIKSIVWDKLEHSRVYCFGKTNPDIYIGSLDPVTHKFNDRIETLVRVEDPRMLSDLTDYMNKHIIDSYNSWSLLRSGEYIRDI